MVSWCWIKMWLWILIGLGIITKVHGFSNGEFPDVCESMLPNHERRGATILPQSGDPPFYIEFGEVINGKNVTVYLKSNSSPFRGFMLEARKENMVDKGCPVGRFISPPPDTQILTCNLPGCDRPEAVSQKTNSDKSSIEVNWTAEGEEVDMITFRATFLQNFRTFWKPVERTVTLRLTTTSPPTTTPSSTTTSNTVTSSTTSTKVPSTSSPVPIPEKASTTVPNTTNPRSTTRTTMPSATNPSSTISTTVKSAANTANPSSTTSTTVPSATNPSSTISTTVRNATNTANPSSTVPSSTTVRSATNTANPSSTISTTVPSATSTSKAHTTTSTSVLSTTSTAKTSTAEWSMANSSRNTKIHLRECTVLVAVDIFVNTVKMEQHIMTTATRTVSPFSRGLSKASKILCCVLCAAFEIPALVLFSLEDSIDVTLVALVCVVIVINIIDLVFSCLPIEPSHELKDICDHAGKVCAVIHMIFSHAVLFVCVWEIENSRMSRIKSSLVKVIIAYTVWIFLYAISSIVFYIYENAILRTNKTGTSTRHRRKKNLNAGQVCAITVSVILFTGNLSFIVAAIVLVLA